jgi:molybdopterin converting factor small subunit
MTSTITIRLRLHGFFDRQPPAGGDWLSLQLPAGALAGEALDRLGVPRGAVGLLLVHGQRGDTDTPLADGDSVEVFPLLGGG